MTEYLQYIVFVGMAVQLIGIASYIKETIKGNTKPNRVSWLMWAIAPIIASFAAMANGVEWAVLPVFMSGFAPLLVFIASFVNKNSYWKLERFDYLCGLFSVLALILWAMTKNATIAIAFAIASDGFASIPTVIKLWKYKETETVDAYKAGLFNSLTSFFAIKTWNFSSYGFPIYLVTINIVFIFCFYKSELLKKYLSFSKQS